MPTPPLSSDRPESELAALAREMQAKNAVSRARVMEALESMRRIEEAHRAAFERRQRLRRWLPFY